MLLCREFFKSLSHQRHCLVLEQVILIRLFLRRCYISFCEFDRYFSMLIDALAEKYFYARRYDDAIQQTEKLLELDPHMRHALEIKGCCLGLKGEWDKAINILEDVHQLTNHPLKGLTPLAYAYAKTGQIQKVKECIAKTEQRLAEEPESVAEADLATMWWALDEKDKAFHYLSMPAFC